MHDIQKLIEDVGDIHAQQKALEEIDSMADQTPVWIGCIQDESKVRRRIGILRLAGRGLRSFEAINDALEREPGKDRIARAFGSIIRLIRLKREDRILDTDMDMIKELADKCITILGDAEYIRQDYEKVCDYYRSKKSEHDSIVWKLKNGNHEERGFAAESLGVMGYAFDMQLLIDRLCDESREVRWNIACSIGTIEQSNPGTLDLKELKGRLDGIVRTKAMDEIEAADYYSKLGKIVAKEKTPLSLPYILKERRKVFRCA